MKIAIASGKGGTGKTTIAMNLALASTRPTVLVDCDVEEPNCHLFLDGEPHRHCEVTMPIPVVNDDACVGCGRCSELCQFNAIVTIKKKALVFPELCHGCGLCVSACPSKALHESHKVVGEVRKMNGEVTLIDGMTTVGSPTAPPVIAAVKRTAASMNVECLILDSPPGTACPAVATVRDADFTLLVTEPTPFGLNDLKLAVEMVRSIGTPFAIAINRCDSGDNGVSKFCRNEGIRILMEIPEQLKIAESYSEGIPIITAIPEYRSAFADLLNRMIEASQPSQVITHV